METAIEHLIRECLSRVKNEEQLGVQLKAPPESKSSCSESFRGFFRDVRAKFS